MTERFQRLRAPAAIWALCATLYVVTLGNRVSGPSPDNHFVHLASSWLHGQLHVLGDRPPGNNDWALYQGRWYVAFPPMPAAVILPAVAIWGTSTWDRLFWALFAGLGPALLYRLLRQLRERGLSERRASEDLALTALFAAGSVFYFVAVQGTVWFAAHVVAVPLTALYLGDAIGARKPWRAGLWLGLAYLTRPTTLLLGLVFAWEAWRAALPGAAQAHSADAPKLDVPRLMRSVVPFGLVCAALMAVSFALNKLRFDDAFEVGYRFLQIRWQARIEKWGLFNYHYLGRNLAVFLAALPWLTAAAPYLRISRHGLALWVTTPQVLRPLSPARVPGLATGLYAAVAAVALMNLCYQNSGWVQFGYRFSLDYAVPLFALIAVTSGRFGKGFYALLVWAIAVNTFGAVTFDRMPEFYDADTSQRVIFQPD